MAQLVTVPQAGVIGAVKTYVHERLDHDGAAFRAEDASVATCGHRSADRIRATKDLGPNEKAGDFPARATAGVVIVDEFDDAPSTLALPNCTAIGCQGRRAVSGIVWSAH